MSKKVLIIGAGFSGAVVARELAEKGVASCVIDRRPHVAGNCHTERDPETGILLHAYGPHIFNTDLEEVWRYVNRFAEFSSFVNRVKAHTARGVFSLPINLHTLNQFFGKTMSPAEAEVFLGRLGEKSIAAPRNFEEQALAMLGSDLYHTFFRGYTLKQWGEDPKDLPASLFKRLPVRFNYNDSYYNRNYQGIPIEGYTRLVENILDHAKIEVHCGTSFTKDMGRGFAHIFYSGPVDRFYGMSEGPLGYRTVSWERETLNGDVQGVACMNYPELNVPWTRKIEHKHFAPFETHDRSVVFTEYSRESGPEDELFYPKRLAEDKKKLGRYQALAEKEKKITFLGRLGTYRYLDMDLTIAEAMQTADRFLRKI